MDKRAIQPGMMLCFSRWNRKGYAIFASLGQEVRIGKLAIHICEMALQKSSRKGVVVNLSEIFERLVRLFEEHEEKMKRACGLFLFARVTPVGVGNYSKRYRERYICS